jgi:hypothetical protein
MSRSSNSCITPLLAEPQLVFDLSDFILRQFKFLVSGALKFQLDDAWSSQLSFGMSDFSVVGFDVWDKQNSSVVDLAFTQWISCLTLHGRNFTGSFTVLDLRFIYMNYCTLTTIGLDWSGINFIFLGSTGSNLRYPPLPTLVWVWWECIAAQGCSLEIVVIKLTGAYMGQYGWQLTTVWTIQFTACLESHFTGVWREAEGLK